VEDYTLFLGVKSSWGINTIENKKPMNQEDNQAPQPTQARSLIEINKDLLRELQKMKSES
jgi:hypothetical protein